MEKDFGFYWKHPFTCLVAASTNSGKTEFVKRLVLHSQQIIDPPPQKIYWCYGAWQNGYEDLAQRCPNVQFIEGAPDINELKINKNVAQLLICDDLMIDLGSEKSGLTELFTRGSHHFNCSLIHIVQNIFHGKRTNRVNAQYIVLMKNPADKLQVQVLARQIFPNQTKYFQDAYHDSTSPPFGYIVLDLTQTTSDNLRLKTNVFPDDWSRGRFPSIYSPK